MSEITVIAYFFNPKEEGFIRQHLKNMIKTESFIYGTIDSKDLPVLKNKGILIDLLSDTSAPQKGIPRSLKTRSLGRRFVSLGTDPEENKIQKNCFLISLKGPILQPWKKKLEQMGVEIITHLYSQVYKARSTHDLTELQNLDFVATARHFEQADTEVVARRSALSDINLFEPEKEKIAIYDIRMQEENSADVLQFLDEKNVDILAAGRDKVRIRLTGTSFLNELRSMNEVLAIEEYVKPNLHNDQARLIINLEYNLEGQNVPNTPLQGEGQIVGVADTGIDSEHPDFEGRIHKVSALGRKGDASDPQGHGTHVAGSILGDGKASNGVVKGMAPEAALFFQSIMDDQGGLGGIPLNLEDLFQEAYVEGVRIHNNSWGAFAESEYMFNSLEVDKFVHQHRDMLIVISAGNDGTASQPRNSNPGYVDWLSLGSPATAKNALTVGASRSSRREGGFAMLTYGDSWPEVFPRDPVRSEKISGDDQSMAGFSSRGPCGNESRIKPDVVAPGSDIASTRSSLAPGTNFWGPYPGNRNYAFMGGTSMSAPIVAGYAALIREYFMKEKSHNPSAALLKAAIINGTRKLTGEDALADYAVIPNFHQGFGCIDMLHAIPNARLENLQIDFIDSWKRPELQFNTTGQRFLFRLTVEGDTPLRICLTWTDPPGRGLQNNLNLFLMHQEKETKWTGNQDIPRTITAFDRDNNVEVIRLENPLPGDYLIAIQAGNIIFNPQDFALAVTGHLTSDLQQQT